MRPDYFKAVKKSSELDELETELKALSFDSFSKGKDKADRDLFRLFKNKSKIGIVVVMNQNLYSTVQSIIEGTSHE